MKARSAAPMLSALVAANLLVGCGSMPFGSSSSSSSPAPAPAPAPAAAPAPAPAPAASSSKIGPGMNAAGEVVDSSKVEAGYGQKVKGLGDWEGEVTGRPKPGGAFGKLQIGMSMKQVTDLIGQPTDSGAYMTGKAWIPFYFGADRHRFEMVYKNEGRLIFAGGSLGNFTGGNLVWIIHNSKEGGYR